jgi:hypothetical protein
MVVVSVVMAVAVMSAAVMGAAVMVPLDAAVMLAAGVRAGAAARTTAAFARKRGGADNYCEREKQCYGRRTHGLNLHPVARRRVTDCYFGCCVIRKYGFGVFHPCGTSFFASAR